MMMVRIRAFAVFREILGKEKWGKLRTILCCSRDIEESSVVVAESVYKWTN